VCHTAVSDSRHQSGFYLASHAVQSDEPQRPLSCEVNRLWLQCTNASDFLLAIPAACGCGVTVSLNVADRIWLYAAGCPSWQFVSRGWKSPVARCDIGTMSTYCWCQEWGLDSVFIWCSLCREHRRQYAHARPRRQFIIISRAHWVAVDLHSPVCVYVGLV